MARANLFCSVSQQTGQSGVGETFMTGVQALEVVESLLFVEHAGCSDGHAAWPFELGTGMAVMIPRESGNLWILARIAEHHKYNAVMEPKGRTNGSPSGNSKSGNMEPVYNDLQDF